MNSKTRCAFSLCSVTNCNINNKFKTLLEAWDEPKQNPQFTATVLWGASTQPLLVTTGTFEASPLSLHSFAAQSFHTQPSPLFWANKAWSCSEKCSCPHPVLGKACFLILHRAAWHRSPIPTEEPDEMAAGTVAVMCHNLTPVNIFSFDMFSKQRPASPLGKFGPHKQPRTLWFLVIFPF